MADFTDGMPTIRTDPTTGEANPDDVVAFARWLAASAADLPNHGSFDPTAGIPHFTRDFSREFAIKFVQLWEYYQAHQAKIDGFLSAGFKLAIQALLVFLPDMLTFDEAGPN